MHIMCYCPSFSSKQNQQKKKEGKSNEIEIIHTHDVYKCHGKTHVPNALSQNGFCKFSF